MTDDLPDLFAATKQGRIGGFPYDPRASVQSFWDLGRNDLNTIWLHQHVGGFERFVAYTRTAASSSATTWPGLRSGRGSGGPALAAFIPHAGDRESLWLEGGTKGVMSSLGFHPSIVERPRSKLEAIAAARTAFARCPFDEGACGLGLRRLRAYRKEWDEGRGVWKNRPRHDEASHGADAFLTFACSGYKPPSPTPTRKRDLRWVV
jgi:hypothetical protein